MAGVAVIGAFVAIITFNYQERQKRLAKDQEIVLDKFTRRLSGSPMGGVIMTSSCDPCSWTQLRATTR